MNKINYLSSNINFHITEIILQKFFLSLIINTYSLIFELSNIQCRCIRQLVHDFLLMIMTFSSKKKKSKIIKAEMFNERSIGKKKEKIEEKNSLLFYLVNFKIIKYYFFPKFPTVKLQIKQSNNLLIMCCKVLISSFRQFLKPYFSEFKITVNMIFHITIQAFITKKGGNHGFLAQ